METPTKLPLDVLGYIADTLVADSPRDKNRDAVSALKMLSLTCKFMVPVCRRHLFANIRFPLDRRHFERERQDRLNKLLLSNPTFTMHYSKNLFLEVRQPESFNTSDYDVLGRICHSSSLTSVEISSTNMTDWNMLPKKTKSIILSLIEAPTLRHLTLDYIDKFPAAALSLCSGLEKLALYDIRSLALPGADDALQGPTITALVSLYGSEEYSNTLAALIMSPIGRSSVEAGSAGSIVAFDRLKSASFSVSTQDEFAQMCKLLEKAVCLERLKIGGKIIYSLFMLILIDSRTAIGRSAARLAGLGSSLAANSQSTLRSVKLTFGYGNQHLYDLNVELRQFSGKNVLEVLEVEGMLRMDSLRQADPKVWAANFDQVLTEVDAFPALRQVAVDFLCYYNQVSQETDSEPEHHILTEAWFPRLSESTMIHFACR